MVIAFYYYNGPCLMDDHLFLYQHGMHGEGDTVLAATLNLYSCILKHC